MKNHERPDGSVMTASPGRVTSGGSALPTFPRSWFGGILSLPGGPCLCLNGLLPIFKVFEFFPEFPLSRVSGAGLMDGHCQSIFELCHTIDLPGPSVHSMDFFSLWPWWTKA